MKSYVLALSLAAFPAAIWAQQTDPCAGLADSASSRCRGDQQKLQQQQLEQRLEQQQEQLQQQQERQNQLVEQQQMESMRVQNEQFRKQLEHQNSANQPVQASATDYSRSTDAKNWRSDNPWFGTDYARTQFAMRYAKQLQRERPDLVGRPFLDAVSDKVRDEFGAGK